MLQPVEIVPIPSAEMPHAARELLQRFVQTTLPAVVVRNSDPSDVRAAIDQLGADLPTAMDTEPLTRDFEFGDAGELGPLGMHKDYMPPIRGDKELAVTYHLTHSGVAVASLLGAGAKFVERHASTQRHIDIGLEVGAHLKKGLVDPDLSSTVCHQATLEPGSLLIFKNGMPYWHWMETQGNGRRSTAFDSTMAIHPGMGVAFLENKPPVPNL